MLVFAKAPVAGEVKTRLQPLLTAEQCANLQQRLIEHTMDMCLRGELCPVELWCAGNIQHPCFTRYASNPTVSLHTQSCGDLGARMLNAIDHSLKYCDTVVIIGTDCPVLSIENLENVLYKFTAQKTDAVFIPAEDGGYVLVACRRPIPELFKDIDWGTTNVMQQTRIALQQTGCMYAELPPLWDIDLPEDLERLKTLADKAYLTDAL